MNVAIIITSNNHNIETFIQNHIDKLPFNIHVFYGQFFPYQYTGSKESRILKLYYKIIKFFKKTQPIDAYQREMFTKHLKKLKIDVVVAEYLDTGAKVAESCKQAKVPLIATSLGYDISKFEVLEKNKNSYKYLFNYASKIIIVSNHMKINLKKYGCPLDKVLYSPAGPSDIFFKIKPTFDKFQLFSLGRFVDKKAPYLTIMAFYNALEQEKKLELIMGGDGPLLQVCKDLTIALKIEDKVKFVGRISQKEQRKILQESFIFIQHSKTANNGDSEGTPVAILEASAAGVPIISTYHAGIPEVVIHNKTGMLSSEGDVFAMAEHILFLIRDKKKAITMGQQGKQRVNELFSLNNHINKITKEINNLHSNH